MREVVLRATGVTGAVRETVSAILTSWLMFVHTLCLDWLENDSLTRDEVRSTCLGALTGALAALEDSPHPPN